MAPKDLDATFERLGGTVLHRVSSQAILHGVKLLTGLALTEDPRDHVAGRLRAAAQHQAVGAPSFCASWLVIQGLMKA